MSGVAAHRVDPGGDHSAVDPWRCRADVGLRLQRQFADAAGDGSGDRPGGGRRHRGGGERASSYRRGENAAGGGDDRRARGGGAGDRHDPDVGGGLCADRPDGRADRRAVSRVCVDAGRGGSGVRRGGADAVAGDELAPAAGQTERRARGARRRVVLRRSDAALCARAGFFVAPPLVDRRAGVAGDDQPAAIVPDAAARAGADRGSGHRTDRHQGAAARQPELCRTLCLQAGRGLQPHAGNRKPLDHQRQRRHGVRHRRHQPDAVAGAPALGVGGAGRSATGGERRRRHQHFRLPTARFTGLHRRAAGADGAAHAAGLSAAVSHPGRGEAECQKQRPVYGGGQRSGLQQPAGGGAYRSRQGQQSGDPHERHRRIAGGAGGGKLPQPLRHGRPRL
ncbi:Uncharacterised protein [Serratia marcescens]|nr:Uncharacterised protein [Serratia marcescens]